MEDRGTCIRTTSENWSHNGGARYVASSKTVRLFTATPTRRRIFDRSPYRDGCAVLWTGVSGNLSLFQARDGCFTSTQRQLLRPRKESRCRHSGKLSWRTPTCRHTVESILATMSELRSRYLLRSQPFHRSFYHHITHTPSSSWPPRLLFAGPCGFCVTRLTLHTLAAHMTAAAAMCSRAEGRSLREG